LIIFLIWIRNRWEHFFRNMPLRRQFMVIYLFALFIPILCLDSLIVISINRFEEKVQLKKIDTTMDKITTELSNVIEQVALMGNNIYSDEAIFQFSNQKYKGREEFFQDFAKFNKTSGLRYIDSIREVANVKIYVDNDTIYDCQYFSPIDESVRKQWWYMKFKNQEDTVMMMEDLTRPIESFYTDGVGTISIIRRLDYFKSGREIILVMDLSYDEIYKRIIKNQSDCDVYICNSNRILFTNDKSILSRDSLPVIQAIRNESISLSKVYPAIGENWIIYVLTNEVPFWYAIITSKQLFILIFVINLLLPTFLIGKMMASTIGRLKLLEEHFDGLQEQKFDLFEEPICNDEIGQLYHHYNMTVEKTRNLFETIIEKNKEKSSLEVLKKQAEINALISQVNPHFMYNTLECIYMRSLIKGERETADVILNLSTLLRQISKWNRDVIELKDELDLVQKYLQIQKYRFDEKLDFQIELEEACEAVLVPKMTIVSFVENACVHGIEESVENGMIRVKVWQENSTVKIEISDSGCGMEPEVLENIRSSLENAEMKMLYNSKSTGVLNAFIRLKFYFGAYFIFHIESKVNEGTKILILLENTLP